MIRLATSSLTFDGFANTEYENLFENAYKAGYRYVEFNCWYGETLTPVRMRELRNRCLEAQLKPVALHVSGFGGWTSELRSLNAAHKIRAMEAARELGCTRVVASAMAECSELDAIVYELTCLVRAAEEYGVDLSLENHCQNRLAGKEDYQYILERVDSPFIGICLDGGHLEAHGEEIESFIEAFAPKINHIHLKENRIFGHKSFCRFGEGTTDNEKMVRSMAARGYSGYLSVELSPEIGENGDNRPFTLKDRRKPISMFRHLEE